MFCSDCSDYEWSFYVGERVWKEPTHCYGKHDWSVKGLIGSGFHCMCACVSKINCQQCQGKRSYPPFTRQVCNLCGGSGEYQPTIEDQQAAEKESKLLLNYERAGSFIKCRRCKSLLMEVDARDHIDWHAQLRNPTYGS